MTSCTHPFKEQEEEQVGGEYTKKKYFTGGKGEEFARKVSKAFQNAATTFEINLV